LKAGKVLLLLTVFISGMTALAVEISASRLLETFFGASNIVWASLIGMTLIYLSIGYYLGGRIADRFPKESILYQITAWAGFGVGIMPFISKPVLGYAAQSFATYSLGLLLGSLVGVILLFSLPITLLGCVSPFAIRLSIRDLGSTGNVVGGIYALSTIGSIFGTFAPALIFIPNIGTRNTFVLFSLVLLFISLLGLFRTLGWGAVFYALMLPAILALAFVSARGVIRPAEGLIYEDESPYNYIQVIERGDTRYLLLNEGQAVQSVYNPNKIRTFGAWDYFLIIPFFNDPPYLSEDLDGLCIIGLGAGTISKQYTSIFGPIPIDGIEIDPKIVAVGRDFFEMNEPNLNVVIQDGRLFLTLNERKYDVIAIDAYRLPYIPFHLTTREFFLQVRERLSHEGVVAINVGRTDTDYRLVEALAGTMSSVFPSVYCIDVPDTFNSLVVATIQPTKEENLKANMEWMTHPILLDVAKKTWENLRPIPETDVVFTDDLAPVEQLTNSMIFRYLLKGE